MAIRSPCRQGRRNAAHCRDADSHDQSADWSRNDVRGRFYYVIENCGKCGILTPKGSDTMIDFQKLDLEKRAQYDAFLMHCGERGCEYSFVNLYLWGRQQAAFYDGFLTIFSRFHRVSVYPFPIGDGDLGALEPRPVPLSENRPGAWLPQCLCLPGYHRSLQDGGLPGL